MHGLPHQGTLEVANLKEKNVVSAEEYSAILYEIWEVLLATRRGIRPVLYRQGKVYLVYGVEYESGYLWYETMLMKSDIRLHNYVYVEEYIVQGNVDYEWEHLLRESGIRRHPYFEGQRIITGTLSELDTIEMPAVSGELINVT